MIRDILQTKEIDVLILDLELEGLSSIFEVKSILKIFQRQKLLYSVVFQNRFMRQMLLKQVFQDCSQKEKLEGFINYKVNQGKDNHERNREEKLALIAKQSKANVCIENFPIAKLKCCVI
jgi:hypothetical protein